MNGFFDNYGVALIFLAIAVYAGLQIWKIKKNKEEGEEELPSPKKHEGTED